MAWTGVSTSVGSSYSATGLSVSVHHTGTDATTKLTTFRRRTTDPITGKPKYVTITERAATITITNSGYHGPIYNSNIGEATYAYGSYLLNASYRGNTISGAVSISIVDSAGLDGFARYWPAYTWLDLGSNSITITESSLFDENNPTESYVDIYFTVASHAANNMSFWTWNHNGYYEFDTLVQGVGNLSRIYIDNPPTYTLGGLSNNTSGRLYEGYSTVTLSISSLSAKCGGNISSAVLRIGDQTDTRTTNGNFTIALDTPGIFTPTVTVTDSRNQTTTKTLSDIIVLPYVYPDITYETTRVKPDMTPDDEGSCILVKSNFTYTSDVETLVEPTVVVKDSSNNTVSVITKWFDNYDADDDAYIFTFSAVSNPIGNPSTKGYYELVDNNYILSTDTSVVTGKTYYAIDNEVDWNDTSDWESPKKLSALIYGFNDIQHSYQLSITPNDTTNSGDANIQTVGSAYYTVDFYAGGHGVAFGKAAVRDGFECGMPATFNNDIKLTIDENAAPGTLDGNLYAALVARGWITTSS